MENIHQKRRKWRSTDQWRCVVENCHPVHPLCILIMLIQTQSWSQSVTNMSIPTPTDYHRLSRYVDLVDIVDIDIGRNLSLHNMAFKLRCNFPNNQGRNHICTCKGYVSLEARREHWVHVVRVWSLIMGQRLEEPDDFSAQIFRTGHVHITIHHASYIISNKMLCNAYLVFWRY